MNASVQQDPARLLDALTFWEEYPRNLGECRVAVAQIQEHRDHVGLLLHDGPRPRTVPVTDIEGSWCAPGEQQWTLNGARER